MADGHLGYVMPIGGVAAYREQVSVVGVGFDIACGNAAIRTDLTLHGTPGLVDRLPADRRRDPGRRLVRRSAGRTASDDAPVDHPLFESAAWDALPRHMRATACADKARAQLGTVGSGNHYVDVFADEIGRDLGRRALRQPRLRAHGRVGLPRAVAGRSSGARACPSARCCCRSTSRSGQDYWALMTLAGEYAYAGREWVARKVVVDPRRRASWSSCTTTTTSPGAKSTTASASSSSARARRRRFPGQKGFVGGSMGDDAVIVQGDGRRRARRSQTLQRDALFSTVHGAGRVMSRTAGRRQAQPAHRQGHSSRASSRRR